MTERKTEMVQKTVPSRFLTLKNYVFQSRLTFSKFILFWIDKILHLVYNIVTYMTDGKR